jgi:hypothetical protein
MAAAPQADALAGFVAETATDDLPGALAAGTREVVADGSAGLLAAASRAWSTGRRMAGFVRDEGGVPEANVIAALRSLVGPVQVGS